MNAMGQKAKVTLERYRAAESLGEGARDRLLETLERRIAAGDWPVDGIDVAPPQAVNPGGFVAKVLSGPVGKIGLGLIIAAVPAAWLLSQREAPEVGAVAAAKASGGASPNAAQAAVQHPEGRRPPHQAVESAPRGAANGDGEVVSPPTRSGYAEPSSDRPTRPARAFAPLPAKREAPNAPESLPDVTEPPPAAEAAPKLDTIDDEMSLLGSAHASLRAGRPSEALAKLAEHKRRFPTSKLAESREVARIIALCQAGQRKTARAAAERFLATHSGSPLANRVRTVCADTGEK